MINLFISNRNNHLDKAFIYIMRMLCYLQKLTLCRYKKTEWTMTLHLWSEWFNIGRLKFSRTYRNHAHKSWSSPFLSDMCRWSQRKCFTCRIHNSSLSSMLSTQEYLKKVKHSPSTEVVSSKLYLYWNPKQIVYPFLSLTWISYF